MTVGIIYNPNATGLSNPVLNKACNTFRNYGPVKIYPSRYPGNTIDLVKKANEECDYIVTMGGDGTMGEAYIALGEVEQNARYSHISVGTANDTADNLGLYKGKQFASIDLFKNKSHLDEVDVDMLTAGGVPFAYVSCCGTFTNLTYKTPKLFKQRLGKYGYYLFSGMAGLTAMPDIIHKPLKIEYEKEGKLITTDALTFIVSNSKTFGGFRLFKDAKINDGIFEISIIKSIPGLKLPEFLYRLFRNNAEGMDLKEYSKYIDNFSADEFNITFLGEKNDISFNHDGDKAFVPLNSDNSLKYEVKKKVKMIIPDRAKIK